MKYFQIFNILMIFMKFYFLFRQNDFDKLLCNLLFSLNTNFLFPLSIAFIQTSSLCNCFQRKTIYPKVGLLIAKLHKTLKKMGEGKSYLVFFVTYETFQVYTVRLFSIIRKHKYSNLIFLQPNNIHTIPFHQRNWGRQNTFEDCK